MTPSLSISDVAILATDLTNHLADHGEWCVGAGGHDTVERIARFIAAWTSGEYRRQQAELSRAQEQRAREREDVLKTLLAETERLNSNSRRLEEFTRRIQRTEYVAPSSPCISRNTII